MNQQIRELREKISGYWNSVSKKNKLLYIGLFLFVMAALSFTIYFVSKPTYVPLFSNELSQQEIGDIKAELDRQGVTDYKLENNGTTISVPAEEASNLLVSLAAKGLPKTGTISFSEMTKDLKFGATDRQLDAMEREALQGQVESLLTHVSGVKSAQVVVSTPEESLFVRPDEKGQATASVVVELEPGVELEPKQIRTLYHLVSKSIPNLPKENIVMTDQGGQGLDDTSQDELLSDNYNKQRKIQNDVEADIQKDLQQMLGTIMGHDKVMIQTFVRLNFDQVQTEENLVEPVNEETNEGIVISAEEISKTYNGQENPTGVTGTGETDVPGYAAEGTAQETSSEELENRVNYEVNRITRNIVQSPYKIDDVTINVAVEPPDPENPNSLTDETIANIEQILSNVVRTALSGNPELTDENIASRITVFPREFSGMPAEEPTEKEEQQTEMSSWWMYALIGAGALLAIALPTIFFVSRRRRKRREEEEDLDPFPLLPPKETRSKEEIEIEEEKNAIKQEIEQMAQHQPDVFVGLLRNWLTKD
jgi:flagellar M-ring protein FliF